MRPWVHTAEAARIGKCLVRRQLSRSEEEESDVAGVYE
jgi:hypothetical protein